MKRHVIPLVLTLALLAGFYVFMRYESSQRFGPVVEPPPHYSPPEPPPLQAVVEEEGPK